RHRRRQEGEVPAVQGHLHRPGARARGRRGRRRAEAEPPGLRPGRLLPLARGRGGRSPAVEAPRRGRRGQAALAPLPRGGRGSAVSTVAVGLGMAWAVWLGSLGWQAKKNVQQAQQQWEKDQKAQQERDRQTLRGQGYMDADKGEVSVLDGIEVRVSSAQVGAP